MKVPFAAVAFTAMAMTVLPKAMPPTKMATAVPSKRTMLSAPATGG